ncbi:MAG: DUF935 domain-containing protein [Desulfovibrio sp.]|nr:DUF935 domain-containing protein [Desulfovibrio sp.]
MPDDLLYNPNALPAKADFAVHADGSLDLANFVGEILPSADPVLLSLGGSPKEYQKLRRDDQVAALMQQRQDKLVEAEWEVVPGGEDSRDVEAADFLRQCLDRIQFDQACRKMHGSLLYGYGVAECLWARDGNRVALADIRVRAPWRFGFAKDGRLKLIVQTEYRPMPPRKFWLVSWGAEDDDSPYGTGLGHMLWWPVYLKRNGARFWAAYLDRFGVPTTKALYEQADSTAENEKRKRAALEAALALRSEGAVAMPKGFDIALVESTSKGSGDFKDFLAYWDDAIAKIILSQTGTSRIGQYSGTAEVHSGISVSVVKADADLLSQSFNAGPACWLTEWNFPGARPPQVWRKVEDNARLRAQAERDKGIADLGLELTAEEVQRRYGDAWQRKSEPTWKEGPDFAERAAAAPSPVTEEPYTDMLAAQTALLADAPQSAMIDAIRGELDRVIAGGGTLEDFAERLLSLDMPGGAASLDELAHVFSGALLAARLAGRSGE